MVLVILVMFFRAKRRTQMPRAIFGESLVNADINAACSHNLPLTDAEEDTNRHQGLMAETNDQVLSRDASYRGLDGGLQARRASPQILSTSPAHAAEPQGSSSGPHPASHDRNGPVSAPGSDDGDDGPAPSEYQTVYSSLPPPYTAH